MAMSPPTSPRSPIPLPSPIQRHPSQSSATSTSSTSSSASFADSENSNDIRASVLNVCIQLGALDDNGRVAEWMFTDPEQPLEHDYSHYYDEFGASAIRRGRSKIKFGPTAALNGANTPAGLSVPSGSRLAGGHSQRGERETTDDEKEPLRTHRRGTTGGIGGLGSISDRLAATFGFRRGWRNSLSVGTSSDTEDGGRNKPIIRSLFTRRSRSHNPSEGRRRPSPPSAHARHLSTSDEDRSSTPRPYHYQRSRPPSLDEDWEQVASPTEASENNVSGRSMTVRRLTSRPLEYYTTRYQNPTFLPPPVTSSVSSEQGGHTSEPLSPTELGVLPKAPQEQQSSESSTSTNVNSNNTTIKTNATDGTIDTKVTSSLTLTPIYSEPQPLLPTPTGPALGLGLGPIKLESIPEARSSRFVEGDSTPPSMPTTPTGIPSSDTTWPISANTNMNVHNNNTPQTPTSPTSTSTYSRARSLSPSAQAQSRFRSRFRSRSRFSLPSMRSATSFTLPLPMRSRRCTATNSARPSSPSSPPVLTLLPLPELTLAPLPNPTEGLRSQSSYSQMHLLMGSMSSPNLSSSGLNAFPSP